MMSPNLSQKFEFKRYSKKQGKIDWRKFQSSFKPDQRDIPYAAWMEETIEGTDSSDEIHGTNYDEEINGYRGNDLIFGYDGDDVIYGDKLSTRLNPDPGVDTVYGGNGNDRIAS